MLRNPLVLALILLGGFIWLLRSPYGDQVRSFVMAEPAAPVASAVATPAPAATAMATAAPESTPTATALPPTATRTLQPTMTPSPTKYVVKVQAIERSVKSASRLITYESVMDVLVTYSDENKLPVWDNGQLLQEVNYIDGKMNGIYKLYDYNGQLSVEVNYINGKENGMFKSYHYNGQLKKEVKYIDGKNEWDL